MSKWMKRSALSSVPVVMVSILKGNHVGASLLDSQQLGTILNARHPQCLTANIVLQIEAKGVVGLCQPDHCHRKNIPDHRQKLPCHLCATVCALLRRKTQICRKMVTQCYEAVKLRTRPRRYMKIKPELLLIHEKGAGFWSRELHCWVTSCFDNKGVFIPPDWGV